MKFKFRGISVETGKRPAAEMREDEQMLAAVPRLKRDGHHQVGGLGELGRRGWTAEEIDRVAEAFEGAPTLSLSMVMSLAGAIRSNGVPDVDHVIEWLRAMLEPLPDGQLVPRKVIRDEAARVRHDGNRSADLPTVPAMWSEAAGSPEAGLVALAAGLDLRETTARYRG